MEQVNPLKSEVKNLIPERGRLPQSHRRFYRRTVGLGTYLVIVDTGEKSPARVFRVVISEVAQGARLGLGAASVAVNADQIVKYERGRDEDV